MQNYGATPNRSTPLGKGRLCVGVYAPARLGDGPFRLQSI